MLKNLQQTPKTNLYFIATCCTKQNLKLSLHTTSNFRKLNKLGDHYCFFRHFHSCDREITQQLHIAAAEETAVRHKTKKFCCF